MEVIWSYVTWNFSKHKVDSVYRESLLIAICRPMDHLQWSTVLLTHWIAQIKPEPISAWDLTFKRQHPNGIKISRHWNRIKGIQLHPWNHLWAFWGSKHWYFQMTSQGSFRCLGFFVSLGVRLDSEPPAVQVPGKGLPIFTSLTSFPNTKMVRGKHFLCWRTKNVSIPEVCLLPCFDYVWSCKHYRFWLPYSLWGKQCFFALVYNRLFSILQFLYLFNIFPSQSYPLTKK